MTSEVSGDHRRRVRPQSVPRGSQAVALAAAVAALGVSIYLTIEHYDRSTSLACPESATINCVKVTTSKWSVIAGVPVALLGLLYFVAMVALLIAPARFAGVRLARLAGSGAGVAMVLYLICIELFAVDAICLWCTAVHVLTLVVFGAVLWRTLAPGGAEPYAA